MAAAVGSLDADHTRAIETSLRERTDLVHALAFARMKTLREESKARRPAPPAEDTQPF
jgi:hypothetical protein